MKSFILKLIRAIDFNYVWIIEPHNGGYSGWGVGAGGIPTCTDIEIIIGRLTGIGGATMIDDNGFWTFDRNNLNTFNTSKVAAHILSIFYN